MSILQRLSGATLLIALASLICGCTTEAEFEPNGVYKLQQEKPLYSKEEDSGSTIKYEFPRSQLGDTADVLMAVFGTPDEPHFPKLADAELDVVSIERLQLAAGPVSSDEQGSARGLYREHCAHCHGIAGDGAGPTAAFLNPYPRDYRKGVFKFKSTPKGERPTHEDLKRILVNGIPGTAMPSFKLLSDPELDALVDYVKYLAIRGEVERGLLEYLAELNPDERLVNVAAKGDESGQYSEQIAIVTDVVTGVIEKWARANASVTEVPPRPAAWDEDEELRQEKIARGRELFYGLLDCKKCHGDTGIGDGETGDYDDWTLEIIGDKNNPNWKEIREYVALGAHEPRNIRPRNLRQGIYRGGRRPVDLFWRVRNGIDGAPMPAAPANVEAEDIWCVIEYVRSLPYEPISQPLKDEHQPLNPKERI